MSFSMAPVLPSHGSPNLLSEVRAAAFVMAGGLLVGVVWAVWAPSIARSADLGEARVAVDGSLALLGIGAGIVTAVLLGLMPGPRPAVRVAVVLVAAVAANLLAAGIGLARGLHLAALGVVLMWPLAAALLSTLRTLAGLILSPDHDRPSKRHRLERVSGAPPP